MRRSAEVIGRRIPAGRHTSCRVLCLSGVAENRGRCKNTRKESADALSFFAIFFGGFPSCGRTGIVWQRASEPLLAGREEEHAGRYMGREEQERKAAQSGTHGRRFGKDVIQGGAGVCIRVHGVSDEKFLWGKRKCTDRSPSHRLLTKGGTLQVYRRSVFMNNNNCLCHVFDDCSTWIIILALILVFCCCCNN